jgi:hypothetical protein
VPRGRPLECGVLFPFGGLQAVREELRHLALDEVERDPLELEVRVGLERGERVVAGGEAVHEDERDVRAVPLAQVQHLPDDHIEEAVPVLNLEERLRLRHPHARAEPAVQLQHHGALERGRVRLRQVVNARHVLERLELRLRQRALLAGAQKLLVVRERVDRDLREPLPLHLVRGRAHGADAKWLGSAP